VRGKNASHRAQSSSSPSHPLPCTCERKSWLGAMRRRAAACAQQPRAELAPVGLDSVLASFTADGAEVVGCGGYTRRAQCFVTQAGVSIGLAKEVGLTFPDWGDSLCNLLVSVIVLNQIIGPPLFKIALIQAGDANPDKLPTVQRQPRQHKLSAFVPRGITPVELSQLS
jgi:hypothetical protein